MGVHKFENENFQGERLDELFLMLIVLQFLERLSCRSEQKVDYGNSHSIQNTSVLPKLLSKPLSLIKDEPSQDQE